MQCSDVAMRYASMAEIAPKADMSCCQRGAGRLTLREPSSSLFHTQYGRKSAAPALSILWWWLLHNTGHLPWLRGSSRKSRSR